MSLATGPRGEAETEVRVTPRRLMAALTPPGAQIQSGRALRRCGGTSVAGGVGASMGGEGQRRLGPHSYSRNRLSIRMLTLWTTRQ